MQFYKIFLLFITMRPVEFFVLDCRLDNRKHFKKIRKKASPINLRKFSISNKLLIFEMVCHAGGCSV